MSDQNNAPNEHGPVPGNTLTDAGLVSYIDGELAPDTGASLRAILEQRADLATRIQQLEQRSGRLSALLADVSPDATQVQQSAAAMRPHVLQRRARRALPPGLRAAAVIALLFGLTLFVPDVRAWVLERVRDIATAIGVGAPAPLPEARDGAPAAAVNITFAVTRDTLDVSASMVEGVLIVRRGSGAAANAEAAGVDARFTFGPSTLQLEGPASPDAVYTVTLPPHVRAVRVQRSPTDVTVHVVPPEGEELRIGLESR